MSYTPVEQQASLQIGIVEFISPDEIKVKLDIEAPDSISLNTGTPKPFPRINNYVLIHTEEGYVVGQIEWITIEESPYPKRQGMSDFGLIDLPYPIRKMSLNPIGILSVFKGNMFIFHRGVNLFPSVGDNVVLPNQQQLKAIIESGENRRVKIGTSPLVDDAEIKIDPDRLFGRHLAVLGNTGSGKSCSVAGLIRWSLEQAEKESKKEPNARFIILDPNGEYKRAFHDLRNVRYFTVEPKKEETQDKLLDLPIWFWNTEEWSAFTKATPRTQRPTLINALRSVREGITECVESKSVETKHYLRTLITTLQLEKKAGSPWGQFPKPKNFFEKIKKWEESLCDEDSFSIEEKSEIINIKHVLSSLINPREVQYPVYEFSIQEINNLLGMLQNAYKIFGGLEKDFLPIDADIPRPFTGDDFMRSLSANAELLNTTEFTETMEMRVKTLLSDAKMKKVVNDESPISLSAWLKDYIGDNQASNGTITIIDMALVPAELVHIFTAVSARMIFEALQRYRKLNTNHQCLPTVLVVEEAHNFIKRYNDNSEEESAQEMCCHVFERIAKEGRKFGLGLVLSSQRPSELSPTVLSQCNSFLLHRINNDKDQELVYKFIPDNLKGLLRDLPSLPSRNAILLGWASELPLLVKMNYLPKAQQPLSDDPDFWDVWTKKKERSINWQEIADDWQDYKDKSEVKQEPKQNESN
jgi:uncharacterized protein